jgi:hypothetical protein
MKTVVIGSHHLPSLSGELVPTMLTLAPRSCPELASYLSRHCRDVYVGFGGEYFEDLLPEDGRATSFDRDD